MILMVIRMEYSELKIYKYIKTKIKTKFQS